MNRTQQIRATRLSGAKALRDIAEERQDALRRRRADDAWYKAQAEVIARDYDRLDPLHIAFITTMILGLVGLVVASICLACGVGGK